MNRLSISFRLAALCAITAWLPAHADVLLQAPAGLLTAGADFELALVVTNPTNDPVEQTPPPVLPVVLRSGAAAVSAVLRPEPQALFAAAIPPGGFRSTIYRGTLPERFAGLVIIDATASRAGRVAVEVSLPAPGLASASPTPTSSAAEAPPPPAPAPAGVREFGFSPHEPLFFVGGGSGGSNARFQLSFKFRPIGPSDDQVAGRGFWEDLYLGFTQTSLWDLHAPSKPFTDSSYRPSLFYFRNSLDRKFLGARLGLASGFEHESNGRDGTDSRSINIVFARPTLRWGAPDGWQVWFSPKFYYYLEKSENADLPHYRGYGDYQFAVLNPRSWKLAATVRAGTAGRGSVLVDASYPFSRINDYFPLGWVHGYLDVQFFNGWGESFLHYNQRAETQFRIGFMAIR
jgi:outer membrane phospholipase A